MTNENNTGPDPEAQKNSPEGPEQPVSPSGVSSTPPPPDAPPSPYNAPQGPGGASQHQRHPQWYNGPSSTPPGYPQAPQGYPQQAQQPQQGYGYTARPKDMTVAYTWAYFLGMFGAHKFYMGQNLQGGIYLGITLGALVLSFLGIGFLLSLFMIFLMYGDLRTMPEQVARSNNGEQFNDVFEFLKKAFRS